MNKLLIVIALLSSITIAAQQKNEFTYYKDEDCKIEVPKNKANFVRVHEYKEDGIEIVTLKRKKKDLLVWARQYKNGQPFGLYQEYGKDGQLLMSYGSYKSPEFLDYDLENASLKGLENSGLVLPWFKETDEVHASLLPLTSDNITNWLRGNLNTSENHGFEGSVLVQCEISNNGQVVNVSIVKGVNEEVDRAIYDAIEQLPIIIPATYNNENIGLHCEFEASFYEDINHKCDNIEDVAVRANYMN